jgi:hypothetical protein
MRIESFSDRTFVLGSIAAVELACVLGIACLGRGLVPVEAASSGTTARPDIDASGLATIVDVDDAEHSAPERIVLTAPAPPGAEDGVSFVASVRAPRTEAEFRSRFREVAAGGVAPLESAVRLALAERGPTCRKVAALRVLCESNSSATDEILAAAISRSSEKAESGDAVPRYALRALVARSVARPDSRLLLERMTWGDDETLPPGLRATAASTLASSAGEAEIDRLARSLRNERDPLVRAGAIEALTRRTPSSARDSALEGLGIRAVAELGAGGEQEQHEP